MISNRGRRLEPLRRGRLEIVSDILNVCKNGALKTEVMYSCNLSHTQLKVYLEELKLRKMLVCKDGIYTLTPFAEDFRQNLDMIISIWHLRRSPLIIA